MTLPTDTLNRRRAAWQLALYACLIATVAMLPFVIRAGGFLTLVADFNEQQTSFNMLVNDELKAGNGAFCWAADLGGSLIGSFSFYNLGSPFFWLSFLFPSRIFPYLMAPLLVLKYTVAALCAFVWLGRFSRKYRLLQLGALLYAFSSFQATNLLFNHFHDVTAFFPLLLWAGEELGESGRRGRFLWLVALSALINYFFFVGEVVFLILYFLFRWLFPDPRRGLRLLPWFFLEGVLGVGLALFLFLPSILWTLGNPRLDYGFSISSALFYDFETYVAMLKAYLLPADVMASEMTIYRSNYASVALWLPLVGTLPLVWLFGLKNRLGWLKGLLITLTVFAFIPVLNSLFYAGNPTFYTRWFFAYTLLLALAFVKVFEHAKEVQHRRVLSWGYAVVLALFLFALLVPVPRKTEFGAIRQALAFSQMAVVAVLGIYASCWLLSRAVRGLSHRRLLLVGISLCSIFLIAFQIWVMQGISLRTNPREAHYVTVTAGENLKVFAREHKEELDGYRFVNNDPRVNTTLVAGVPSVSSFLSTVNGNVARFYDDIGSYRFVISKNEDRRLQTFLGVRYVVSTQPRKLPLVWEKKDPAGTTYIYEYADHLPLAYCFDRSITDYQYGALDSEGRLRLLMRALVIPSGRFPGEKDRWLSDYLRPLGDEGIYRQDLGAEHDDYLARKAEAGSDFVLGNRVLSFKVRTAGKRACLITTPYDTGWEATVNGRPVPIANINGLMAVPVEAGKNEVVLHYSVTGLKLGAMLSLASLALSLAYCLLWGSRRKRLALPR